jgi:hypothetical protein
MLDFTYEQNMFLIEKALKLENLIPFTRYKPPADMANMLSESWVFGEYISPMELSMLGLRIKPLVSYLVRVFYPPRMPQKLTQDEGAFPVA